MIQPRDYQIKAIDEVYKAWADGASGVFLCAPCGAGKCLGKGTPVLMFDGTIKPVEDIKEGEQLIGHPEGPFLVPPRIYTGSELRGLNKIKTTAGDFNQGDLQKYMMQNGLMGDIVQAYQQFAEGRKGVVFCVGIEHSKQVADQFNSAGIRAEHLDGTTPDAERAAILKRLRIGETRIVSNASVLCEGFDEPSISYVGLARPTKSLALYIQQAGRGLRIHPEGGKTDCVIIDHGGNVIEHGHILEERLWSLKGKPTRETLKNPFRECRACHAWIPKASDTCPHCGFVRVRPQQIYQTQEAEFTEAKPENLHPIVMEYKRLLKFAKSKGIKPGWAFYKLIEKFEPSLVKHHLPFRESKKIQELVYGEAAS